MISLKVPGEKRGMSPSEGEETLTREIGEANNIYTMTKFIWTLINFVLTKFICTLAKFSFNFTKSNCMLTKLNYF